MINNLIVIKWKIKKIINKYKINMNNNINKIKKINFIINNDMIKKIEMNKDMNKKVIKSMF